MNLTEMRNIVRRDLHDEDAANYRWTDDELNRHIARVVREFSEAIPLEQKTSLATTAGSRELNIAALTDRVMVEAAEYPVDLYPVSYQRFALWGDTLVILDDAIPDGSNCRLYYGKLHTLDASTSTIPAQYEEVVAAGAAGYAALGASIYTTNRVNSGGTAVTDQFREWAEGELTRFKAELKRLGRRQRIRVRTLYQPAQPVNSQTRDFGP